MGESGTMLLLVRHGKAEPGTTITDAERKLTLEGVEELIASCQGLCRSPLRVDVVVCSPLERAKQTAAIVSRELAGGREPVVLDELAPGAMADALVAALAPYDVGLTIAAVGHAPDLGAIVGELIEPGAKGCAGFLPGSMALLAFPSRPALRQGKLLWARLPKDLAAGHP